jgi:hypothetical protein
MSLFRMNLRLYRRRRFNTKDYVIQIQTQHTRLYSIKEEYLTYCARQPKIEREREKREEENNCPNKYQSIDSFCLPKETR